MRLHRLTLSNYRGITHRDIEFPERGVVVVSGANEIGKSSMIEALDLLLAAKDRSTKKEVKQVKPTHSDVGAEVTAEISTGPYRFVYRKRFHKRCETHLTVVAPQREQLAGDEAHDRVQAMLAETVDTGLWQAQRVLQSAATAAVDLSGCDALSRALDVAAGDAVHSSAVEPLLIDRIDTEYLRYFTATGRPTGEWAAAAKRRDAAIAEVARCEAAVAEVDDAVRRHTALTAERARLAVELEQAVARLAAARAAADEVDALTQRLEHADVLASAAQTAATASAETLAGRRRLRADIDQRTATVAELRVAAEEAAEERAVAHEVQEAADAAAEQARAAVTDGDARVEAARRAVERLTDRDEAVRLTARLAKIDTAQRQFYAATTELAGIALTGTAMREIESAAAAVERAAGVAELASARVELAAEAELELRVAGVPVRLPAGQRWSGDASSPTDIELPGLLTVRVLPGAPAAESRTALDTARRTLAEALTAAGADGLTEARALDAHRRELCATRDRLAVELEALTADASAEEMRIRLAGLDSDEPGEGGPADTAAARERLDAELAAHRQRVADTETGRQVALEATKRLSDKTRRADVLGEKLAAAQGELSAAADRLTAERSACGDDELAVRAEADAEQARRAAAVAAQLREELRRRAPEQVAAALGEAARHTEVLGGRHDEVAEGLREVGTRLSVYGTEGRQGRLDAAQSECEHAETHYQRVGCRARAAETLRSVMARHRTSTRQRYVAPFRAELQRLGRLVFGDSFEVDIDSDLRICTRTVDGCTVPYDSLSGGAREQLGIVARLAGAALVADEDSVPVIIDDALGFTDADRLTKMGAVFDAVGGAGQVIVLTCSPQRYAGVGTAHHIALTG